MMRLKVKKLKNHPNYSLFSLLLFSPFLLMAQNNYGTKVDGVAAVIGEEIVLESDIEREYFFSQQNAEINSDRCEFLNTALANKLLLHHAKLDTLVEVTNDQVQRRVDAQIQDFKNRASEDKILEFWGLNTMAELRAELSSLIEDAQYSNSKKNLITKDIDATPEEIREFFLDHQDELPDVPEELEIAHLVIYPEMLPENRQKIIDQLNQIKQDVEDGASFATEATLHSEGPSSIDGGMLPNVKRRQMVPEFEAVAFNLEEGQVSEPFETEFGYHIALLEKRKGQTIDVRHILIKPKFTNKEIDLAYNKLDSIRTKILNQEVTFREAVREYSIDKYTKFNAGNLTNQETGDSRFDRNKLPVKMLTAISGLKEGDISYVFNDIFEEKKAIRLVEVQRIIPAHKVNFETDFSRLKNFAIQFKKQDTLNEWIKGKIQDTFVKIHRDYKTCDYEFNWEKS